MFPGRHTVRLRCVANMSLSGGSSGADDLLSMAVDNLDQANMVSAVAAGNDGPASARLGRRAAQPGRWTAGAITVGHFIGVTVTDNDEAVDYAAAVGQFAVGSGYGRPGRAHRRGSGLRALLAGSFHERDRAHRVRRLGAFSVKIRNA